MEIDKPISVVISTRKINDKFIQHLKDTAKCPDIEVLAYENDNEYSLTQIYNKGLKEAKNDIIVFCHDDIIFDTPYWHKKLMKHFKRNPDYGIIGVAGTDNLVNGQWWLVKEAMHGIVNHSDGKSKWTSTFSRDQGFNIKEMITLDGLFFAVDRTKIKEEFDEDFKGFHFYDVSFTFANHLSGVKIGVVTDIRLTHLSVGKTNESWDKNRKVFESKYVDKLPYTIRITEDKKSTQLINIITRTSNRPNGFARCCESIDKQTYKNINHIVCIDNPADADYVKANNRIPILVDREKLISEDKSIDPMVGSYSPHNLYFNEIQKEVKEGWVVYLDDDNFFSTEHSLQEIINQIETSSPDSMIFWRIFFAGQFVIPEMIDRFNPPKLYHIDSGCFAYHSKYINDAIWDGWKCADFRVISKLYKIIPRKVFIPKVLITLPVPGNGNKKDIE
jgi:glycosyltransferase involved in cell wall biosynthesis